MQSRSLVPLPLLLASASAMLPDPNNVPDARDTVPALPPVVKPADKQPPPSPPALDSSPAPKQDAASYSCQWVGCDKLMPDPETLYNHLCNDHIGRKSTGNLCLTCHWKDCGTTCAKRDHITSHLRGTSHIPQIYSHSVFSSPRLDPVPF